MLLQMTKEDASDLQKAGPLSCKTKERFHSNRRAVCFKRHGGRGRHLTASFFRRYRKNERTQSELLKNKTSTEGLPLKEVRVASRGGPANRSTAPTAIPIFSQHTYRTRPHVSRSSSGPCDFRSAF